MRMKRFDLLSDGTAEGVVMMRCGSIHNLKGSCDTDNMQKGREKRAISEHCFCVLFDSS